jgi:hypothetical protein
MIYDHLGANKAGDRKRELLASFNFGLTNKKLCSTRTNIECTDSLINEYSPIINDTISLRLH